VHCCNSRSRRAHGCRLRRQADERADADAPRHPADRKDAPTNKEPSSIVALSQDQLAKEYLSDQEATKKKYAGKFLEIAGVVWTAKSDNIADIPQLLLRVYKDPAKWNGNNRCE
jgi:hypothetical protein